MYSTLLVMPTMVNSRRLKSSSVSSSFSSVKTTFLPRSASEYSSASARHSSSVCGILPQVSPGRSSWEGMEMKRHGFAAPPATVASASALFSPSQTATRASAATLSASVSSNPRVLTRRKSYIWCSSVYSSSVCTIAVFVSRRPQKKPTPSATIAMIARNLPKLLRIWRIVIFSIPVTTRCFPPARALHCAAHR